MWINHGTPVLWRAGAGSLLFPVVWLAGFRSPRPRGFRPPNASRLREFSVAVRELSCAWRRFTVGNGGVPRGIQTFFVLLAHRYLGYDGLNRLDLEGRNES